MAGPPETLSALCNGEIRGRTLPSRMVALFVWAHHGDGTSIACGTESIAESVPATCMPWHVPVLTLVWTEDKDV